MSRKFVVMTNLSIHRTRIHTNSVIATIMLILILQEHTNFMCLTTWEQASLNKSTRAASKNVFLPRSSFGFLGQSWATDANFARDATTTAAAAEDGGHHVASAIALDSVDSSEPRVRHADVPTQTVVRDMRTVEFGFGLGLSTLEAAETPKTLGRWNGGIVQHLRLPFVCFWLLRNRTRSVIVII